LVITLAQRLSAPFETFSTETEFPTHCRRMVFMLRL
jgi:hypothetical protein